ncbi:MAG: hypothetical protein AAF399_01970 [Bacteroidota bacterium]
MAKDEVALEYYRLKKIQEIDIALEARGEYDVSGNTEADIKHNQKEETERLSRIIEVVNERLGADFTEADQLYFDQMEAEMLEDNPLLKQAQVNTLENFRHSFADALEAYPEDPVALRYKEKALHYLLEGTPEDWSGVEMVLFK